MKPEELRYTKTHEWAYLDKNVVVIGVSKFAADQLSDITYIEMPDVGDHIFNGQEFGNIETVKAVSDLYAPVDGEVIEINEPLEENPELLKEDPLGKGWIVKVRVEKPNALDHLMSFEAYKKQLDSEPH